jgi:serine/threonine-protein kinase
VLGQLERGKTLGQYEIITPLGQGGMASVYRAYQTNLDREVAIKVIAPQFANDPAFAERFRREARSIARLRHPNILTVYDAGEETGMLYLAMELVEGQTLKEELQGKGLDAERAARLISQVASALDYAHSKGIIHRDVKPANVLLDQDGRAVLSDFGIAKLVEANTQLTGTGVGVGTPDYMSPEQAMGEELDARSDEYSLGVMAYELLSGQRPFTGDTPIAIIMGHVSKALPSLHSINPKISKAVEQVVNRALAKKPAERYESCGAFAKALTEAIHNSATFSEALPTQALPAYSTQPEAEQLYQQARLLEQQNNFHGAFDAFTRLDSRSPGYRDVSNILFRYRQMGYALTPATQSAPTWQSGVHTQPVSYYSSGPVVVTNQAKSGNQTLIFGGIGAAVVAVIVILVLALANSGNNPKEATPTATAQTTAAVTTPATTSAATTAAVTTAPATTPATTRGPARITSAVMSKGYDSVLHEPIQTTTTFKPTDNPLHAVVNLGNPTSGTKVGMVLIAVDAGDVQNYEVIDRDFVTEGAEDVIHFTAQLPNNWPVGKYKVDIYLNDKLDRTIEFTVEE